MLEGIAMAGAGIQEKLDDEFLGTRIRNTNPDLMRSGFSHQSGGPAIWFTFSDGNNERLSQVVSLNQRIGWMSSNVLGNFGDNKAKPLITRESAKATQDYIELLLDGADNSQTREGLVELAIRVKKIMAGHELVPGFVDELKTFLLYAPENHFLRRFEEEGQIRPLGIRGEGLFRHLTELAKEPEILAKISEQLQLIDWFEGFSIPNDLQFTERRIAITDRFIKDTIAQIDQRSANEGFLYLLFYFTLFLSKYTPSFFAIDNIDNALNPRLCAKLVETLVKLAKENDKQAIFTTHNPAVLDGLDLADDAQRLFVIYRNADGETKARRVMPLEEIEDVETPRLSEAFMRGYLGGLPQNF